LHALAADLSVHSRACRTTPGAFEPARPRRRSPPMDELFDDALLPALTASIVAFLLLLYVWGIVGAYRAAGDGWKTMDRDVRLVFLLAVPLFRGGIQVLLWLDRLFYIPKAEKMTARGSDLVAQGGPGAVLNEDQLGRR
jgi:hypothetical protein